MTARNDLIPFKDRIAKRPRRYAIATDEELDDLAATFPEPFIDFVRRHGWCSMSGDTFWFVSPRVLAPALADWQFDLPVQAFARNALGEVHVLCQGMVVSLFTTGRVLATGTGLLNFLNFRLSRRDDLQQSTVRELKRDLGPIEWDECFTYTPALPIETDQEVVAGKGKLIPYVSIIGQLVAPVKLSTKLASTNIKPELHDPKLREQLMSVTADARKQVEKRKREKGY